MNVEIGTEAAQFPEKEHINGIFVAVQDGVLGQPSYLEPHCLAFEKRISLLACLCVYVLVCVWGRRTAIHYML